MLHSITLAHGQTAVTTERRLTILELFMARQHEENGKVSKRQTLQERGLIAVIMALNALAHEKLPDWARYAASLVKVLQ